MEPWYLLYDGSSEDGRGEGKYVGRTTDHITAKSHYDKCKSNPYSTGGVLIVTDKSVERAWLQTNWPDESGKAGKVLRDPMDPAWGDVYARDPYYTTAGGAT